MDTYTAPRTIERTGYHSASRSESRVSAYQNEDELPGQSLLREYEQRPFRTQVASEVYAESQTRANCAPCRAGVVSYTVPVDYENAGYSKSFYRDQTFGKQAESQYVNARPYDAAYDSRTHGAAYDSRTHGAAYDSRTYGPAYDSRTYGPAYDSRTYGAAYDSRTYGPAYDSRTYGAAYDSRTYGSPYDSRTNGAAYDSRTYGPAYDSRTYGAAFDSRTYGSPYNSRAYGAQNQTAYDSSYYADQGYDRSCYQSGSPPIVIIDRSPQEYEREREHHRGAGLKNALLGLAGIAGSVAFGYYGRNGGFNFGHGGWGGYRGGWGNCGYGGGWNNYQRYRDPYDYGYANYGGWNNGYNNRWQQASWNNGWNNYGQHNNGSWMYPLAGMAMTIPWMINRNRNCNNSWNNNWSNRGWHQNRGNWRSGWRC